MFLHIDLHGHDLHDHLEDLHDHLEDLHDHIHGGDFHDLTDKHYNTENDTEVLSPDESQRADDVINAVATPLMLNGELSEAEINEFVESVDSDIAIAEGLLTERTIVKFDKNAKRAQLYEVAVAACAREHNDPDFRKLQTVYKMERILKKKLRKKYNSQAQKKVKEYLARAKKSKSGIISRIAHKITGK